MHALAQAFEFLSLKYEHTGVAPRDIGGVFVLGFEFCSAPWGEYWIHEILEWRKLWQSPPTS